ncbi:MAG: hypothetical protein GX444_04760 [Myxococcales bacterium]|nr:hypothetical protein [Myxococcales bacterium]
MERDYLQWSIEEFFRAAATWRRPLFMIPHQDDELGTSGLIQRIGAKSRVIWVTNGDGLYFEMKVTPEEYGNLRMKESVNAVGSLGIAAENTRCLAYSEVEIYRRMSLLQKDPACLKDHINFWAAIREGVRQAVFAAEPDAVFTLAWQGGHPEHDLTHYFTRLAVDDYEREIGRPIPFFHMPAYEYTVLLAFRFNPFYRGPRLRFTLTRAELEGKRGLAKRYPTQAAMMERFIKFLDRLCLLGRPFGAPKNGEEYLGVEHFGPVPPDLDYAKGTHFFNRAHYIFEDYEGIPITFKRCIRPVVEAFPRKPFA